MTPAYIDKRRKESREKYIEICYTCDAWIRGYSGRLLDVFGREGPGINKNIELNRKSLQENGNTNLIANMELNGNSNKKMILRI